MTVITSDLVIDLELDIGRPQMPATVSERDRHAPALAQWLVAPRSERFRFA